MSTNDTAERGLVERAAKAEADAYVANERRLAVIARAGALADEWDRWPNGIGHVNTPTSFARMLRAALSGGQA